MKKSVIAWIALIVPIWIAMILCTHWEPVQRDGWGHFLYQKNIGLSPQSLYDFAKGTYTHNNPRLGQVLTLLLFTPGPWHSIVTPIVELGMFYLLSALVLGRWPSIKRTDDALLFLVITAMTAITAPQFGLMLFYRPYTGNYLYGLVINLLFLVPYRFEYEARRTRGWWWMPIMAVLGFASGLSNEHTGPAVVAIAAVGAFACWRRDRKISWSLVVGLIFMILGGIALFKAPGQAIRYKGLASQASLIGRILDRGLVGNLGIIGSLFGYLSPAIVWVLVALAARFSRKPEPASAQRKWAELALAATALAIIVTLLASPKVGSRLFLASAAIGCAAIGGVVVRQLAAKWSQLVVAAGSAIVLLVVGYKCVVGYHEIGQDFAARMELLSHASMNSVLDLPSYPIHRSRWILDDDLKIKTIRDAVSFSFGLALIRLDGVGTADIPAPDDP
jgi:hypothetical protein